MQLFARKNRLLTMTPFFVQLNKHVMGRYEAIAALANQWNAIIVEHVFVLPN
ncbi:MAG: hypothetical protein JWQ63_1857 [Mucilaginibacter sp.]|nr:hypothetical protein [Mucilaginibacter sp.]